MPEIRYIETYDSQGNLIDQEPYEVSDEVLEEEATLARLQQIVGIIAGCHASHMLPPPDLSSFVLLICEYITLSQPR